MHATHPWAHFSWGRHLHSWNSAGAEKGRRWRHLPQSFPKTYRSVLSTVAAIGTIIGIIDTIGTIGIIGTIGTIGTISATITHLG